jgi:uncharacterized protein YqgV (UPF0045/DUF77 family)
VSTSQLPVNDSRPRKPFSSISIIGYKALDLVNAHKVEIESRLPGVGEDLSKYLEAMSVVVPGAIQARNVVVAFTSAQNALLQQGCDRAREIRETVRRAGAAMEVRKAYGVGRPISPNHFGNVIAALQQIVQRATEAPEEAASFGLIDADVAALAKLIDALTEADSAQDQKRASAPLTTKERNRTGNRIIQTVVLIAGAGRSAFADEPSVRASFNELMEALKIPGKRKAKKKASAAPGAASVAAPSAVGSSGDAPKSPADAATNTVL